MNNTIKVKFKKLTEDAVVPKYSHDGDVCMDMTAVSMEYDIEHDMYIYHTGLAFESDKNIGQFLFLRSSNCKTDAYLCNGVGVADSAIYRGEIQFRMKNREPLEQKMYNVCLDNILNSIQKAIAENKTNLEITELLKHAVENKTSFITDKELRKRIALENAPYKVGDRVGQMVFMQYPTVELIESEELSDTERGEGGFGSTGK